MNPLQELLALLGIAVIAGLVGTAVVYILNPNKKK